MPSTKTVRNKVQKKRGFTLVEVMVSTGILSMIVAATMSFYVYGLNYANYDEGKQNVNRDLRSFTDELTNLATHANYFQIYDSFQTRTVKDDGSTGDFLLLVYLDSTNDSLVQRIVGFYRFIPADGSEGPVLKFDQTFSGTLPLATTLIDSLPSDRSYGTHQEVIELSKGLANNKLFYNFYSRSVMVRGEIVHEGTTTRKATNTYNFTVSPRG